MLRAWHLQRQGIQSAIHAITVAGTRAQGRAVNHVGQAELSPHVGKALAHNRVCTLPRFLAWTVFKPDLMNVMNVLFGYYPRGSCVRDQA
jgi:hypothetical protein